MKYLKIENAGLLPMELLYLMGGTTKAEESYKIGQFGTGLKYSMAYLLRENIHFSIFIGEDEVDIQTKELKARDTVFDVLTINGRDTSITTNMGTDWECWMIIRELYCNALDEGGVEIGVESKLEGKADKTTFYIQLTPEVKKVWDNFDRYFIHSLTPLHEGDDFAVYPSSGNLEIYKQGVLIHKDEEKSVFRYDIKNATINELREYRGWLEGDLCRILYQLPAKLVEYFLENVKGTREEDFDYTTYGNSFGDGWNHVFGSAKVIDYETFQKVQDRGVEVDGLDHVYQVPKGLFKKLIGKFDGISALRVSDKVGSFVEFDDPEAARQINKGLAILETCDYNIDPELKWSVGFFGASDVRAQINIDDKHIMFSEKVRDLSLLDVCTIIVEENEHYRTGFDDCTRDFQTHFIKLFTRQLLEKESIEL